MKKTPVFGALFLGVLFLLPSVSFARPIDDGDCYIQKFLSDVTVKTDSSADITEHLTVDCGNLPGKHGIFRIIPYQINNRPTTEDPITPIYLKDITDARGVPYHNETTFDRSNNTVTWKIGDPNVEITGIHEYYIKYSVRNVIQHPDSTDLFAWNLNGNYWLLSTDSFIADIHFPTQVTAGNTATRLYTGEFGGTDNGLATYQWITDTKDTSTQMLEVRSLAQLKPYKGITVYTTVPQHIFAAYTQTWFERYGGWFWLLLIPLMSLFFWRYWQKYGKDKKFGAQVVFYDAPGDMRPMELGVLDTYGSSRPAHITATLIDLAVRGYITITEMPKQGLFGATDWLLTRTAKDAKDLKPFEAMTLTGMSLTEAQSTVKISDLKNSFYVQIPVITGVVRTDLDNQGLFDMSTGRRLGAVLALSVASIVFGVLAAMQVIGDGPFADAAYKGLPVALLVSGVIGIVFAAIMPRRTDKGAELEYQVKGFQLYMKTAEKYRAQFYEKENMFEKVLPYAILFGLTDKWIKATRSLSTDKMASYSPMWYLGTSGMPAFSSFDSFSSQMNTISQQMSAAVAPPSSSGGGGGFSGGGGGGGGGGSW